MWQQLQEALHEAGRYFTGRPLLLAGPQRQPEMGLPPSVLPLMAEKADVVLHNNRPQVMTKLGLDYATFKAVNPSIIYCGAYGYSTKGPYGERGAMDEAMQAGTGSPVRAVMVATPPVVVQVADKASDAHLAEAVQVTMGPRGRTVILDREFGPPQIVNSGVLVARAVELEDPFENMGAHLLREVAARTSEMAGDGTTTATVLAAGMIHEGLRYLAGGMNPMDLKRGIERAIEAVVAELHRMAQPCATRQDVAHVAAISANNDTSIGDLLASAIDKVGREGAISIEDGSGLVSVLEVVEGMQFANGYLSSYFVQNGLHELAHTRRDLVTFLGQGRIHLHLAHHLAHCGFGSLHHRFGRVLALKKVGTRIAQAVLHGKLDLDDVLVFGQHGRLAKAGGLDDVVTANVD